MTTTQDAAGRRGLVLGGGGIAGIAWELGLLAGLREQGVDLADADVVVGTSAGSVVGTVLRQGGLGAAYAAQSVPVTVEDTGMSGFDLAELMAVFAAAAQVPGGEQAVRAEVGAYARRYPGGAAAEAERVGRIASLLPSPDWPPGDLRVTGVDAEDGTFLVHDASSGVPLPVALAASCAVPGVGPTITVAGRPVMDGGMRSGTNADVAQGCGRVLVVACNPEPPQSPLGPSLPRAVAALSAEAEVLVVEADAASRAAAGTNPLLMSTRGASAAAGFAQAATVADRVRHFWG